MERLPTSLLLVYVALVGIGALFATLLAVYVVTRLRNGLPLGLQPFPRYFSLSTIVLLVSSYTLGQAPRLYRADDLPALVRCLGATLLLGSIFSGLQVLGWRELYHHGLLPYGTPTGTFVYLITALHVAHIVVGLGLLLANLLRVLHAARDGVRTLVFIRNPYHRRQLQALGIYWHFIDALWVLLFVVFLF
ncbi:MAG: cytochrome c oxidase subunit 3 [Janthinobacterium lividum]